MPDKTRDRELQGLATRPGEPGSGLVRYAAAMYFHKAGLLDQTTLELYRALAKDDGADPLQVARASGGGRDIERLIAGKS